jgi:hypothetical protein
VNHLSASFKMFASAFVAFALSITGCSSEQQSTNMLPSSARSEVTATTTLLATIGDQERLAGAGASSGHAAVQNIVFSALGTGVAYITEKNGVHRVVHNGRAGRSYPEVQYVTLSPDGGRIAYGAAVNGKWRMVVDGREGMIFDQVGSPRFSPDGRHILYDAKTGEHWQMVVDEQKNVSCPPRYDYYDKFFSSDSTKIIFIENPLGNTGPLRVIVSDLELKRLSVKEMRGHNITYNNDRTRMALIAENSGKKQVVVFSFERPDADKKGLLYDAVTQFAFGGDGVSTAYVAERGGKRFLVLNGKEELLPDGILRDPPAIRPDNMGAGVILDVENGFIFYQAFSHDSSKRKKYQEAAGLIYNMRGSQHAYIAKQEKRIFMVVNDTEGPAFDMIVTPMFSPDGKRLVYRARKDGRRFVVVANTEGKILRQHPVYEQVFQPVFTADGKSVAYGVKDGQKLIWKVEKL